MLERSPVYSTTPLGYGSLQAGSPAAAAVEKLVAGKNVWDLGAGQGLHTLWLSAFAKRVTAIDKELYAALNSRLNSVPSNVSVFKGYFSAFEEELDANYTNMKVDVAFLSWPVNRPSRGLVELLRRADYIVYVGLNDGVVVCGTPELFAHLASREVVEEHVLERSAGIGRMPSARNAEYLTIYGPRPRPIAADQPEAEASFLMG